MKANKAIIVSWKLSVLKASTHQQHHCCVPCCRRLFFTAAFIFFSIFFPAITQSLLKIMFVCLPACVSVPHWGSKWQAGSIATDLIARWRDEAWDDAWQVPENTTKGAAKQQSRDEGTGVTSSAGWGDVWRFMCKLSAAGRKSADAGWRICWWQLTLFEVGS